MELIDRYLQATKFWLPRNQKRDIIQELSEDLHSQIEEKERAIGRPLNEDEVAAILKQCGSPLLVAGRYYPQQHLIGPLLFPFYSIVLKMVALCYLLPWVLVWLGFIIFDRQYRAVHLGAGLLGDWARLWVGIMFGFAAITIAFAMLERAQAQSKILNNWDPRKLPAVVKHQKPSFRTQNLFELFFTANFVVWWLAIGNYPHTFFGFASELFKPASGLGAYYWPLLGLALMNLAQQITNAARPQWTWLRPATLLITNSVFAVMLSLMLRIEPLVVLKQPYTNVVRYAEAAGIVNIVARWTLTGMFIGVLIACAAYIYQIARLVLRWRDAPATVQVL